MDYNDNEEKKVKITNVSDFFEHLQKEMVNLEGEKLYFTSNRKEDIIKKVYRKNVLDNEIHLEFWNGYKCSVNLNEFKSIVENFYLSYYAILYDIAKMDTSKGSIKDLEDENNKHSDIKRSMN